MKLKYSSPLLLTNDNSRSFCDNGSSASDGVACFSNGSSAGLAKCANGNMALYSNTYGCYSQGSSITLKATCNSGLDTTQGHTDLGMCTGGAAAGIN